MRKKLTILLILTFVLGVVPINFSEAITQSQISAEVQVVCPDNYGNWYSGSGTIIDPKGIILTNKHVVSDQYDGIIKTCFIGFTESINQEPNFGTQANPNLAEVKYYTTATDMDAAILYLENPTNKSYTYVDVWNSNSNTLQFGHKIEAIGFPSIGGSTITYTSGDFSGFGSASDGTQNYIKSTTPLEHGNSGGAAYNPTGEFIGIPTMVVAGTLNSLSYILSVNSITNWLSGILGNNYQQEVIEQKPIIETPKVSIQNDITPPIIKNAPRDVFWYNAYNKDGNNIKRDNFLDLYEINEYRTIEILISNSLCDNPFSFCLSDMDDNGVYSTYYSFSNNLANLINSEEKEFIITSDNNWSYLTPKITIPDKEGNYYIGLKFKDNSGNISGQYIITYVYEKESFLELKNIKFYSDPNYSNMIGNYDFKLESWSGYFYPQYQQYCVTNKKDVYVKWEYENNYSEYAVTHYNEDVGEMSAPESLVKGGIKVTSDNKYRVTNLDKAKENNEYYGYNICEDSNDTWCHTTGKVSSFLLKPKTTTDAVSFEGKHTVIKFAYNPNYSAEIRCGEYSVSKGKNNFGHLFIVLSNSKPLVDEDAQTNSQAGNSDEKLINRVRGKILLQVEAHGEAYYVYPKDSKRYYMANGNEAYRIMRYLGVGITNADLNRVKTNKNFAKQHSGKIFLQVEAHGEAFYIDFDGNAHYLKNGSAAYTIMRDLGLGITNSDLSKIPEGNL